MEIPKDWLTGKVKVEKLQEQAIETDRWDEEDLARSINTVPPFAKARRDLQEFTPTGRPALNDVYYQLLKAEPEIVDPGKIRPSHLVNRTVAEELQKLDDLEQLRHYSVNDDVQAALSASVIEKDVEIIFDRLKQEQQAAEEFEQKLKAVAQAADDVEEAERDLDQMMKDLVGEDDGGDEEDGEEGAGQGEGDGDGDGQEGEGEGEGQGEGGQGQAQGAQEGGGSSSSSAGGQGRGELTEEQQEALDAQAKAIREAQERLEELQAEAEAQAAELGHDMEVQAPMVSAMLAQAVEKATDEARGLAETAAGWGLTPGELKKMNAEERLELARRLQSDRLRRIADLFGPMRNIMFSEQARKTTNSKEEVFDIETGHDLTHLLPSELLMLDDDDATWEFLRRYSESSLMQYALQGTERLARGGIIFCEDGSGSMSGDREMWAKAVMLCLLHLARTQKRTMHLFHFGSPGQIRHIPFVEESDFTLDRIIEAAELFFSGGTDFVTPMKAALKVLQAEFAATGGVRADVVFVTDDECYVDEAFMTEYLNEMHRMDATTWGISVTGNKPSPTGALSKMCEGKTCTVKDFASGGDIREVFGTVT